MSAAAVPRPGHPRRRTVMVLVVTVAALAFVVLVGLRYRHLTEHGAHVRRALPMPAALPAGTRLAVYGPVSLRVPASLPTRTTLCGYRVVRGVPDAANEVIASDGVDQDCPLDPVQLAAHPGTVVWLTVDRTSSPFDNIPTTAGLLAGVHVLRGYVTVTGGVWGVVRIPNQHIVVGVTAPDRAAVDRLLDTVRVTSRNPLGCAAHLASAVRLVHWPPAGTLVPAGADSAVRCVYSAAGSIAGTLIGSYRLDRADTVRLARALNALRPDPCGTDCTHGSVFTTRTAEVLYFRVHGRWTAAVTNDPGDDSYTDGVRTVVDAGSVAALLGRLTRQV